MRVLLMWNAAPGLCNASPVTGFTLVMDQNDSTGAPKRSAEAVVCSDRLSIFQLQPNEKPIGKEKESLQIVTF